MDTQWITTEEAAQILGISNRRVRLLINKGKLRAKNISESDLPNKRLWRVWKEDVLKPDNVKNETDKQS